MLERTPLHVRIQGTPITQRLAEVSFSLESIPKDRTRGQPPDPPGLSGMMMEIAGVAVRLSR